MSDAGREYIYSHPEDLIKLTASYVNRYVIPLKERLDAYIKNDVLLDVEDLVQDGVTEILSIADHYDPTQSSLGTWIFVCLHHHFIRKLIQSKNWQSNTPPGRMPLVSLDVKIHTDRNQVQQTTLADFIPDPTQDTEEQFIDSEDYRLASELVNNLLTPREKYVLDGLLQGKTLETIGQEIGRSRERVRQVKEAALRHTRQVWRRKVKHDEDFLAGRPVKKGAAK